VGLVLILVFVVAPLIELAVFVQVAHWIGYLDSFLLLVLISVGGVLIVRYQGIGVYRKVRGQLRAGVVPAAELVDGLVILVAGVLLILPGFISSIVGLVLLIPPVRRFVRGRVRRRFSVRVANRVVKVVNTRGPGSGAVSPDSPEVLPPEARPLPPPTPPHRSDLDQ
jgi:UPF0716 protein FxsA